MQSSSTNCLNIAFCPSSHNLWPQQTTSLVSSQNIALAWVYFYSNRLCRRGAARMRPKRPCPPPRKNLLRFFAGVLYQSQLFENKQKEQSHSRTVVFSHWPRFKVTFCDWMRNYTTKACNFVSKLPINADNTSWGVAWRKSKDAAFLQKSTNSDETFLRGSFAWSIAEPDRNILGQDMINPKRTTQWSVMQQRNVSHSTVGIVASEYAKPGRRVSISKCAASHCQRSTQTVNITFITVSDNKYRKSLVAKPLLATKHPWWFCVKAGVNSFVSLESRIWQMDIYVV